MKKRILIIVAAVIVLVGVYFIGSGFVKSTSAYISNYAVSADGSEMSIGISVGSSAGYVRKVAIHQQHIGKLYLDCYSAFGGINGSIRAKQEYTIPLF